MIQPTIQMIRYGRHGDVWELQTFGYACHGVAGEHDPRTVVKTEATGRGTAYLCVACASIWLDPDARPAEGKTVNQCDGCRSGWPIENGIHRSPKGGWDNIGCTADRYSATFRTTNT